MPTKIILDCDPGHDDAVAMLLAWGNPDIELIGVTTVVGNQTIEKVTRNALSVARVAGITGVPFAQGAGRPLLREIETAGDIHGESGLDGPVLPEPMIHLDARSAAQFIVDTIMAASPGEITLVPTGGLTNIALAARLEPRIIPRVKEVVLMGGGVHEGNWSAVAEFNIVIDPEAAAIVFGAGWPVTMVGLDVTHQAVATPEVRSAIAAVGTGPAAFVGELMEFFERSYLDAQGFPHPPVHDPVAVAYVIDPTLLRTVVAPIAIETRGEHTLGMTVVDLRGPAPADCVTRVCLDLDAERFWSLVVDALERIGDPTSSQASPPSPPPRPPTLPDLTPSLPTLPDLAKVPISHRRTPRSAVIWVLSRAMESFRYRDGLASGMGRGALNGGSYARPFAGIRSDRELDDVAALARAFLLRLPDRAFYFGRTAAALHDIPLPTALAAPLPLHLGVAAGARRVHGRKLVGHHIDIGPVDITRLHELPVTTVGRTWCDLAADGALTLGALVAAGDRILWRRDPLGSRKLLGAAVARYHGRRGTRLMRTALPLLSDRSDSAPESELRVAIVLVGLPTPDVNLPIRDEAGRLIAKPDLSWPSRRVLLEYEGDHHRVNRDQWHRDLERFGRLQEIGWVVLRATASDYHRPDALLRRLSVILTTREST